MPLTIVMTLLARNEQDIIRENILFHRSCGVSAFIVTDNCSQDGTRAVLNSLASELDLLLWVEDEDNFAQATWVTRMARHAAESMGADWVINGDADEFFVAADMSLPDVFARADRNGSDVIYAGRGNMAPVRSDVEPFYERMVYRETSSTNLFGRPLGPKAMHRASPMVTIDNGNHRAWAPGFRPPEKSADIDIVHFPLRSYDQFESKVTLGTAALERNVNLEYGVNEPWRRAYSLYKRGRLRELYEAHEVLPDAIDSHLERGRLTPDYRVRDALRDTPKRPVHL